MAYSHNNVCPKSWQMGRQSVSSGILTGSEHGKFLFVDAICARLQMRLPVVFALFCRELPCAWRRTHSERGMCSKAALPRGTSVRKTVQYVSRPTRRAGRGTPRGLRPKTCCHVAHAPTLCRRTAQRRSLLGYNAQHIRWGTVVTVIEVAACSLP